MPYQRFTVRDMACQKQSFESRVHSKNIRVTHQATKTITEIYLVQLNNNTRQVTSLKALHPVKQQP
jgi:hypothetical protein